MTCKCCNIKNAGSGRLLQSKILIFTEEVNIFDTSVACIERFVEWQYDATAFGDNRVVACFKKHWHVLLFQVEKNSSNYNFTH